MLVLVFFGIVPVCVTYYIERHEVTAPVLLASIACGLVIDALLLVNNFRDRFTDREAGKMTLVVRIGEQASLGLYLLTGVVACAIGSVFLFTGQPLAFVLPLVYLVLHLFAWLKMKRVNRGKALNHCLGETARNIFIYGLALSLGLLL